jgi:hypothetical protein
VAFRISGDRDLERRDRLQAGDQLDRVAVAVRVRLIALTLFRRVAAKSDDVPHAGRPIFSGDVFDLGAARLDAGEVGGGVERGLARDPLDRGVGARARRAAGAVSDGHEAGGERLERLDRLPEHLLHLLRLGREELEADVDVARDVLEQGLGETDDVRGKVHATSSSRATERCPSQIVTVRSPPSR